MMAELGGGREDLPAMLAGGPLLALPLGARSRFADRAKEVENCVAEVGQTLGVLDGGGAKLYWSKLNYSGFFISAIICLTHPL